MKIAIVGAGWAGLAAAVSATRAGHHAIVFEASKALGGRARGLLGQLPSGQAVRLDNGQHILIGAYRQTLHLLREVGVDAQAALLRLPLTLRFPDGSGLRFANATAPLDALWGVASARGFSLSERGSLLRAFAQWRLHHFECDPGTTVAELCHQISPRVRAALLDPLCLSALNTPVQQASAEVFLRVLQDTLGPERGSSNLLLPRVDLSTLFPLAAQRWLQQRGCETRLGQRIDVLVQSGRHWLVQGQPFDAVMLATSASESSQLLMNSALAATDSIATPMRNWAAVARALRFEAIATVYAWGPEATLTEPMLTLHSGAAAQAPAQFVFDRGQLGGPAGLLAFVVSACQGDRASTEQQVLQQAREQLSLTLQPVQTIVEKRATFACTAGLQRPGLQIAPALLACGDYVAGPYPATLEGAVRSGAAALAALLSSP